MGTADGEFADWLEPRLNHEVIYNHGKGTWHKWDPVSGLWLPDNLRDVEQRVDAEALANINDAVLAGEPKAVTRFMKLRDWGRINSTLQTLASREDYKTDGSKFDADPFLLGVKNGVVDLRTCTLLAGEAVRGLYVSQSAAVAWPGNPVKAAKAAAPFYRFVLDVLGGDKDLLAYTMRLLGYSLIGTTQEEKFWLLAGAGRNGKGTLTKLIHWLLGTYAGFLDPSLYIRANRFGDPGAQVARPELGNLWGKRFTVTSEPVKGEFNEQMLKAHTGRDPISFRRMRSDRIWTFEPTHKLFFLTQHAPKVEDVGPSMRARARVLWFEQDYTGRENQNLREELQQFGEGILVVLAYEAMEYLKSGLPENSRVLAWSDQYINENDPVRRFIAERCVVGTGIRGAASLIRQAYEAWCEDNGEEPMTANAFGRTLIRDFKRVHSNTGAVYIGIRSKNAGEVADDAE